MILLFLFFSACFASSIHGEKLHEYMTYEEIKSVFKVEPESLHTVNYELAAVYYNEQRIKENDRTIRLNVPAFKNRVSLYLEENNHVLLGSNTTVYIAKKAATGRRYGSESEIVYTRMPYPVPRNFKLYHDVENRAAVTIHTDDENNVHVHGTVGDDLIIRALPSRVHREVLNESSSLVNRLPNSEYTKFGIDPTSSYTHHIIIKTNATNTTNQQRYVNPQFDPTPVLGSDGIFHYRPNQQREYWQPRYDDQGLYYKERSDNTVYPEMLVVVDYESYFYHGSSINEVALYMAAFWNAVDLRFRELDNPKVRLNIAGLVIAVDYSATEYIYRYPVGYALKDDETLASVGDYFSRNTYFPKHTYDFVFVVLRRKMGYYNKRGIFLDTTAGIAYNSGVCLTGTRFATGLAVDKGGFDGIIPATHETGHLMGAEHDFEDKFVYENCRGYLMDYKREDNKGLHWSTCSITAMKNLLQSQQAHKCLNNIPKVLTSYNKILPGRLLSRDDQCQKHFGFGSSHHKILQKDCALLWCLDPITRELENYSLPPAEGTKCDDEKICLNGLCVPDPERIH